jgi:hypothetical protein
MVVVSLNVERCVLDCIKTARSSLEGKSQLTDGTDNLIQGVADKHEEFVYLLQQRQGGRTASYGRSQMSVEKVYSYARTAAAEQYHTLADATSTTGDRRYGSGDTGVYYAKNPRFSLDQDLDAGHLNKTHALVGYVNEKNPNKVFEMMQGEIWSPNGEARSLISKLGLRHTSMSVGDVVAIDDMLSKSFVVAPTGFKKVPIKDEREQDTGNLYLVEAWTGPVFVKQMARKAEEAGLVVQTVGTEKIYVHSRGTSRGAAEWNMLAALRKEHGTDFGLKPRAIKDLDDLT